MAARILAALILAGIPGVAMTLDLGAGAHFDFASLDAINSFITLVNRTIEFANGQPNVSGSVSAVPELHAGTGADIEEMMGLLGMRLSLGSWGLASEGTWTAGGSEYRVALSLAVKYLAVGGTVEFSPIPGYLAVGLFGGWGLASLDYSCTFSLPSDWEIPFQPATGEKSWRAAGPVGEAYLRVTFPVLGPGLHVGLVTGLRLAAFGTPVSDGTPLDLDADGKGDDLSLSGMWVGAALVISLEF